jgi:protein-disulfide isomerase
MQLVGQNRKALVAGIVLLGGAVAVGAHLGWRGCAAIADETAKDLSDYVRIKARVPANVPLNLAYAEPVGQSCYQAVHFRAEGRGGADLVVFLSPDQKFVSRDLSDWRMDKVLASGLGLPQEQAPQSLSEAKFQQLMKGDGPVKGPSDAPIKIALFTDFQCSYCRQQAQILKNDFKEPEIQIAFHHLPLRNHPWAKPAAELAACVARQSEVAFWELYDAFYRKQEEITPQNVEQFVRNQLQGLANGGVDIKGVEACAAEHRSIEQVDADIAAAAKYGFNATPSMFINGVRKQGVVQAGEIRRIVQRAATNVGQTDGRGAARSAE